MCSKSIHTREESRSSCCSDLRYRSEWSSAVVTADTGSGFTDAVMPSSTVHSTKYLQTVMFLIEKQPEEASTHKSAKTHAGNVLVMPRDLEIWPFDPKINGFPGFIWEHFCIKFGDPSCIGFWNIVQKNKQTHKQTGVNTLPPPPRDCSRRE